MYGLMPKRLLALIAPLLIVAALVVYDKASAFRPECLFDACEQSSAETIEVHDDVPSEAPKQAAPNVQANATVIRAVDGDTVLVELDAERNREFKVRMLGVNTPESVDPRRPVECFGKEASNFTKKILDGKRVRLEEDPQADEHDKYGRLLRNVILEDGTDFNAKLIEDGYAQAYLSFPLNPARKTLLRRLEGEAKAAQRGLWNPQTCLDEK